MGKRKTNPIKYLEPRKGLRIFNVLNKEIIKVMARQMNDLERSSLKAFNEQLENSFGLKAVPISGEDVNGMTWYSINKNGRPTGDQVKAFSRTEAVDIWNKIIMP